MPHTTMNLKQSKYIKYHILQCYTLKNNSEHYKVCSLDSVASITLMTELHSIVHVQIKNIERLIKSIYNFILILSTLLYSCAPPHLQINIFKKMLQKEPVHCTQIILLV